MAILLGLEIKTVVMGKLYGILGLITILFFSCKNQKSDKEFTTITNDSLVVSNAIEGKKLLEQKCYLCHSPSAPEKQGRVGPPMIAVKAHYLEDSTTKEEFIEAFTSFVLNPAKENVKLKGAVKRFGLMPKSIYEKEEVEKIASFVYDYKIEEPNWFKTHWQDHGKKLYKNDSQPVLSFTNEQLSYKELGLKYALGTKKVLGKNLMGTIQDSGVAKAVEFCNIKAYPLTDSMAVAYNAKIKRVSDKPRNPKNTANKIELQHIETFKKNVATNEKIAPIVEEGNQEVHFYYPIITNDMCLKCHGKPKENITLEVQNLLSAKYPEDKATGYNVNQVRGIWSITLDKKEDVQFQ